MHILQITDPHLYGRADRRLRGVATDLSLRAVLDEALTRFPEFAALLATGDIVQEDAGGYLRFRSICAGLDRPVLCIPGNHDELQAMRRELQGPPFQLCGARTIGAWRFVMLDSCVPGAVGGRLAPAELARLDEELAGCEGHAFVCLHHHPIPMGSGWLDSVGLAEADEFWRVIDAHPGVKAVAWGHVHQRFDGKHGSVRLFATPSTGAQFLPGSEEFAMDRRPPAYRHFRLHADGRIDSRVHWVDAPAATAARAV